MKLKLKRREIEEKIGFGILRLATLLIIAVLFYILYDIYSKGGKVISWEFITRNDTVS